MADFVKLTVTGLEDLTNALNDLPTQSERNAVKPAMRKAARPMQKAMRANIRARTEPHTGNLRKATTKREVSYQGAFVIVLGPRAKTAPHAHLVEEGTKERFRKKRSSKGKAERLHRQSLSTGKMPAFHPVRDAFTAKGSEAVSTAEKELWNGIAAEAAKLGRKSRAR